jgi:hypothetical protein
VYWPILILDSDIGLEPSARKSALSPKQDRMHPTMQFVDGWHKSSEESKFEIVELRLKITASMQRIALRGFRHPVPFHLR